MNALRISAVLLLIAAAAPAETDEADHHRVLIELFTSQGAPAPRSSSRS